MTIFESAHMKEFVGKVFLLAALCISIFMMLPSDSEDCETATSAETDTPAVVFTNEIHYQGLIPGENYYVVDSFGNRTLFTPEDSDGTVIVSQEVDWK